ncbi:MAG: pyridoxal phosphate-dependent aminotransferase [Candidatus Bathyarchaeota archaeon]|nr:MAG: pyridoxal phosphate-dependent aminotransferase [Candidatus Bathyarchaeota archaeon]
MLYEISQRTMELESEGKKIIKLNIGDPDQPTPKEIIEAAFEAMKHGKTKYSFYAGEKTLRTKLASIHNVSAENVIIIPGSKWAFFSIMYLLLKNGGNAVILTPYWTAYEMAAKILGVEIRFLKAEFDSNWKIDIEKLRNLIDQKTRLLILNNPNNPTSKVLENSLLEEIVEVANDKKVTIMSDEVYRDLSFVKTKSTLDFGGSQILVNSFSKTFAMTGWRIGYVVVDKELAGKMMKLNQMTFTNVPVFVQEAALKALELKEKIAGEMKAIYRRRADLACKILSETELKFTKPDAPFYIFPKYANLDSEKFAFDLLDKRVAITPGTSFGDYREHFRIALTMPEEEIKLGLEKICEALE